MRSFHDGSADKEQAGLISLSLFHTGPELQERQPLFAVVLLLSAAALFLVGLHSYRPDLIECVETLPRMPVVQQHVLPLPVRVDGSIQLRMPNGNLLGNVGTYPDELGAYLRLQYLRSLKILVGKETLMTSAESDDRPSFQLYVVLPNNLLQGSALLSQLEIGHYISAFTLESPPGSEMRNWKNQTRVFEQAYSRPVREKLMHLPAADLHSSVARFILFKVRTDDRVRQQLLPVPRVLTKEESQEFAADMIAVAKFYDLPLEMLLGIGAMENNYLDVRGDRKLAVWKKRAQRGDIVLRRRHGRVLVANYSLGPWQITRETLRYVHALCMHDHRDYDALPARLRPPKRLDLDRVDEHVLTTYAGMLLRTLLDYFHGNVTKAEGAYNGGEGSPNLDYAEGVAEVATYAHRVLSLAAGNNRTAIKEAPVRVVGTCTACSARSKAG